MTLLYPRDQPSSEERRGKNMTVSSQDRDRDVSATNSCASSHSTSLHLEDEERAHASVDVDVTGCESADAEAESSSESRSSTLSTTSTGKAPTSTSSSKRKLKSCLKSRTSGEKTDMVRPTIRKQVAFDEAPEEEIEEDTFFKWAAPDAAPAPAPGPAPGYESEFLSPHALKEEGLSVGRGVEKAEDDELRLLKNPHNDTPVTTKNEKDWSVNSKRTYDAPPTPNVNSSDALAGEIDANINDAALSGEKTRGNNKRPFLKTPPGLELEPKNAATTTTSYRRSDHAMSPSSPPFYPSSLLLLEAPTSYPSTPQQAHSPPNDDHHGNDDRGNGKEAREDDDKNDDMMGRNSPHPRKKFVLHHNVPEFVPSTAPAAAVYQHSKTQLHPTHSHAAPIHLHLNQELYDCYSSACNTHSSDYSSGDPMTPQCMSFPNTPQYQHHGQQQQHHHHLSDIWGGGARNHHSHHHHQWLQSSLENDNNDAFTFHSFPPSPVHVHPDGHHAAQHGVDDAFMRAPTVPSSSFDGPFMPSYVFNRMDVPDAIDGCHDDDDEGIPPAPLQHADAYVPADLYTNGDKKDEGGGHNHINAEYNNELYHRPPRAQKTPSGAAPHKGHAGDVAGLPKAPPAQSARSAMLVKCDPNSDTSGEKKMKVPNTPHPHHMRSWTSSPPPAPAWVFFPGLDTEVGDVPPAPAWSADDSALRLSPSAELTTTTPKNTPNDTRFNLNTSSKKYSPPPPTPVSGLWGNNSTATGCSLLFAHLYDQEMNQSNNSHNSQSGGNHNHSNEEATSYEGFPSSSRSDSKKSSTSTRSTSTSTHDEAKEKEAAQEEEEEMEFSENRCMELCENLAFETANAALATDDEGDDEATDETSNTSGGSNPSNQLSEVKLDFYVKGPLGVDVATLGNAVLFKEFFEYGQLWPKYKEGLISLDDRLVEVEGLTDPKEMLAKFKSADPNTEKKIVIEHRVCLDRL